MFGILKRLFGTAQGRLIKKYRSVVRSINELETTLIDCSDAQIKRKTEELKQRLEKGVPLEELLPEAYAVVKNVCRRLCGTQVSVSGYTQRWDMIPYDEQILAAIAMHYGIIAEMQTGEGKTLTAAFPLYLNALTGKSVHLITVNDYLAERDAEWIGEIFRWLGLTVRAITSKTDPKTRKRAYLSDVLYLTAAEAGFDYLRDNSIAQSQEEQVQRGHYFCIIDEVDSILIDEARTPLIISGPSFVSHQMYSTLKDPVAQLVSIQAKLCDGWMEEITKTINDLGFGTDEQTIQKFSKKEEQTLRKTFTKLWIVSKGAPKNPSSRLLRENPDVRAYLEKIDLYFCSEVNKEERHQALSELYVVVEEKNNEFELTDKGMHKWAEITLSLELDCDFLMLDLGHEYALIDAQTEVSEEDRWKLKLEKRTEDALRKERVHNVRQLFRAYLLMEKDVDYLVHENQIIIIDENTGRPQPKRRFSDGLHQAIEAKEGVTIQAETQTYAVVSLQNYFRRYKKLSGMTGTAMTEAAEFLETYKLNVLEVPTHNPCVRKEANDKVFLTEREKLKAIIDDIIAIHETGRPILVGTESVESSEIIAKMLIKHGLKPSVLNAKNPEKEAETIARAGQMGAITVATNMAGRGTDIKLGKGVADLGGLHLIGVCRHTSRRIDRQLLGRCARQGDKGSAQFYSCIEDSLMRQFSSPMLTRTLQHLRPKEGEAISAKILNKSIETAQKRIEQRNHMMRKHTMEYDDVLNKQREEIYAFRNEILHSNNLLLLGKEIIRQLIEERARSCAQQFREEAEWDWQGYQNWLTTIFPLVFEDHLFPEELHEPEDLTKGLLEYIELALEKKIDGELADFSAFLFQQGERQPDKRSAQEETVIEACLRMVFLRPVNQFWKAHLTRIEHLRTEVAVATVGQKDPLIEFKTTGFELFIELKQEIYEAIAKGLFSFSLSLGQRKQRPQLSVNMVDI